MDISKKRIYILIGIAVIAFILGRLAARASIKPISAFLNGSIKIQYQRCVLMVSMTKSVLLIPLNI